MVLTLAELQMTDRGIKHFYRGKINCTSDWNSYTTNRQYCSYAGDKANSNAKKV